MTQGAITKLLGCDAFNKQLREHLLKKGIFQDGRGRSISSYSLRRNFIQGIMKKHTTGDTVEWLTGDTVPATLSPHISNRNCRSG